MDCCESWMQWNNFPSGIKTFYLILSQNHSDQPAGLWSINRVCCSRQFQLWPWPLTSLRRTAPIENRPASIAGHITAFMRGPYIDILAPGLFQLSPRLSDQFSDDTEVQSLAIYLLWILIQVLAAFKMSSACPHKGLKKHQKRPTSALWWISQTRPQQITQKQMSRYEELLLGRLWIMQRAVVEVRFCADQGDEKDEEAPRF